MVEALAARFQAIHLDARSLGHGLGLVIPLPQYGTGHACRVTRPSTDMPGTCIYPFTGSTSRRLQSCRLAFLVPPLLQPILTPYPCLVLLQPRTPLHLNFTWQ